MMSADATPRVGFSQLKNFIGKTIIFVGQLETIQGQNVTMQAPDGSRVTVQSNMRQQFDTKFCEVTGVVVDPCTIQEESHVNFGDKFGEQHSCMVLHISSSADGSHHAPCFLLATRSTPHVRQRATAAVNCQEAG